MYIFIQASRQARHGASEESLAGSAATVASPASGNCAEASLPSSRSFFLVGLVLSPPVKAPLVEILDQLGRPAFFSLLFCLFLSHFLSGGTPSTSQSSLDAQGGPGDNF